jgi:protein SCO1/2
MQLVFDDLGDRREHLRFVFITIDPARDNADRIRSYLDEFDPAYIGLTGTLPALEKVYAEYSVDLELGPASATGGYEIDHTARIFVIDREGFLVETFPYGLSRQGILGDLQHLIDSSDG